MLAWMNRTAIERTLAEGYACYYSRSRQSLWRKGETSGHLQVLNQRCGSTVMATPSCSASNRQALPATPTARPASISRSGETRWWW